MNKSPTCKPKRSYLRKYFWVRRHPGWGWAVCWYQWHPLLEKWGVCWGLGFKDIREAKAIRRFLNARVRRRNDYGTPFAEVVKMVNAGNAIDQPEIIG